MIRFVIFSSYGNDSCALIQWAHEWNLEGVAAVYSDTGWATEGWAARVAEKEEWVRSLGFTPYRTSSIGFRQLARQKKGFPTQRYQWCSYVLKIEPGIRWLEENDPNKSAICIVGARRAEAADPLSTRATFPEYLVRSENHGGRMMLAPMVDFDEAARNALLIRAGVEPLPHRSGECKCITRIRPTSNASPKRISPKSTTLRLKSSDPCSGPIATWARPGFTRWFAGRTARAENTNLNRKPKPATRRGANNDDLWPMGAHTAVAAMARQAALPPQRLCILDDRRRLGRLGIHVHIAFATGKLQMSRSGYVEDWDGDDWQYALCRGRVVRAFKGKRGQAFLKDMLAALDAMPEKRLIAHELQTSEGAVCAIGSVGRLRGVDMSKLDPEDVEGVAGTFDIAPSMAREIVYENDEGGHHDETPEDRYARIRKWIVSEIIPDPVGGARE